MQIIPTILEKEWDKAEARLDKIKTSTTWVQIDVADNEFTNGKSFDLEVLSKYVLGENLLWEIHLMVKEPINWMEKCIFAGASRVTGQVEMMGSREDFVKEAKDNGLEAGLAFDIETKIDNIPDETDLILLMGRKAGFGYLEMDERIWERIEAVKKYEKKIGVDGGVNLENLEKLEKAGVDVVYSGSNYWEVKNVG